jgi:hypothetical protein
MIQQGKRQKAKGLLPFALALCVPVVAGAQTARNPFADLFGRAPSSEGSGEATSVQLRSTAGAQIGQTLRADFDQGDAVPEGLAAGADASLSAQYLRNRVQVIGQGRYAFHEYRREPAFGAAAFDAGGRVNFEATTRLSLQAGGQFVRSPYFRLLWLPPEQFGPSIAAAGPGSAILMMTNDTTEVNGGLTAQLARRTSLSVLGSTRQTRFEGPGFNDFKATGGRAVLQQRLTRSLGVRAGYAREESHGAFDGATERYVNEILDLGVDFAKSFSMARRTTFSLASETSMVRQDGGDRQFRLNGTATFERLFLRTWIAQLSARRGTEFLPGFAGPVFTDRGGASLAGYLTKQLVFNAHADGGQGSVGAGNASKFTSYSADIGMTYGLTRHFGVFGQYYYYHYRMPPDPLALVTVQHLSRQAVSIGVKTWVSIIDKEKVPRDPR